MEEDFDENVYFALKATFVDVLRSMTPSSNARPELQDAFWNALDDYAAGDVS